MKRAKAVGIVSMIAGILMVLLGGLTWGVASSQLAAENITVPEDSEFMGGYFRGKQVTGPLSAYAQAEIIQTHSLESSKGKTFAELGTLARQATTDGDEALAEEYNAQRQMVQTGSFLRASLFSSIIAFGVAAMVMGTGLLFALIGWALCGVKPAQVAETPIPASDQTTA